MSRQPGTISTRACLPRSVMNRSRPRHFLWVAIALLSAASLFPVAAQRREHLTPEEIEFVRDAQQLDLRTAVFIKAAERRLLMLTDPTSNQLVKDAEKLGELKGTRAQLLGDLRKILDEAVVNIDDAHVRDPKSAMLGKSLSKLSNAAKTFLPRLMPLRDSAREIGEREAVEEALEEVAEIVEAAKRHDVDELPETEKSGKKGSKDN